MKKSPAFQLTEKEEDDNEDDAVYSNSSTKEDLFGNFSRENLSYVRYKNYDLHLIKQKEIENDRPKIPASQFQRLAYFRYFCCSLIKQQVKSHPPTHFLRHLWFHVYRNIFEHLPHLFTVLFLSVYTPHEHFYSSKMVPLFWGCSIQIIVCGFLQMAFVSSNLSLLLDYVVFGVLLRGPWNRCKSSTYEVKDVQNEVQCYNLEDFIHKDKRNVTFQTISKKVFFNKSGSLFHTSQVLYYGERRDIQFPQQTNYLSYVCVLNIFVLHYCVIWMTAPLFYRQLFKKIFWKMYNYLFWIIFAIYGLSLFYIELMFYTELINVSPDFVAYKKGHYKKSIEVTFERYGEILTAPPVVHLIHARSQSEVKPGRHSALLAISTSIYFLYQEIVYLRLQNYCDAITGISLRANEPNSYPFYYLWPIFFDSLPLGSILTKVVFITLFLLEYFTFVITYQCMIEVVACEWKRFSWWKTSILLTVAALVYRNVITNANAQIYLYVVGTSAAAITEIIVVYWLYPAGRLIEDINFFYYANSLTKLRRICIQMMPIIFMIAMVVNKSVLTQKLAIREVILLMGVTFSPVLFGFVYKVVWIYVKDMPFKSLIRPMKSWGPQDHVSRMYRKKFDERKFIDSLSDRLLSKHMMKKAEPPNYQLGVQYESFRKRSSSYSVGPIQ